MAEDPAFSGMSSGDAAKAFSAVISKIKSDMAAIERSAKNIEASLSKASRHNLGGGGAGFGAQNAGGATGSAKPAMSSSSFGQITGQLGGASGIGHTAAFAGGALAAALTGHSAIAGGIALAGLPDLIQRPQEALSRENSRFGMAQATGDFGTFQRMMNTARNDFNVQDDEKFRNTLVYGTQRAGMVGINGGGTIGERRAAAQIGGYNTLAAMAGIDQGAVPGIMKSSLSANNFYASMASGVMTVNPVTGETIGMEGQVAQEYSRAGFGRMTQEQALQQIDINYGEGRAGRVDLLNRFGGNEDAVDTFIETMRMQARNGGKAIPTGGAYDVALNIGEEGGLGTEYTQGNEGTRELEAHKAVLGEETLNAATAGIEEATKHITNAVDLLADLPPELEKIRDAYVTVANQMDVFKTELPGATQGITDFLSGLPGMLFMSFNGGKGGLLSRAAQMLTKGGKAGTALRVGATAARAIPMASMAAAAAPVAGLAAGLAAVTVGVGLAGSYAVHNWTDYDKNREDGSQANEAIARNAGTNMRASGYGSYAKGDWFVESDQTANIHYGEMILPNRIAKSVREELAVGKTSRNNARGRGDITVNINLTISRATDQEALQFAHRVKRIIENDRELYAVGAGRFATNG